MMLFFERQKTLRGEWPSIYMRDQFPENVRIQCWQLVDPDEMTCRNIALMMRHAVGCHQLNAKGRPRDPYMGQYSFTNELHHFYLSGYEGASELQNIEYAFSILELLVRERRHTSDRVNDNINYRLRLGGVGYKIVDHQLVPVDDEHLTESAVIPAISLLNRPEFSSAYAYLHQAFLDYREGSPKSLESSIDNTMKAGESLLRYIFEQLGYFDVQLNWTYSRLVQHAKEKGLFPEVANDKLNPLMNELQGLAGIRNTGGGHGVPDKHATDRLVRLAIHHATSNLLYIAETYLEEHR